MDTRFVNLGTILRQSLSYEAASEVRISSLAAWPAVGGGLLLGMVAPLLSGHALLRPAVKTVFIRIDAQSRATVIVPYVRLEERAADDFASLVAYELRLSARCIEIDNRSGDGGHDSRRPPLISIVDLGPAGARSLLILAALARSLLEAAAAEEWEISPEECVADSGLIVDSAWTRKISFGDIAKDAALLRLPPVVTLRSGEPVLLHRQTT